MKKFLGFLELYFNFCLFFDILVAYWLQHGCNSVDIKLEFFLDDGVPDHLHPHGGRPVASPTPAPTTVPSILQCAHTTTPSCVT